MHAVRSKIMERFGRGSHVFVDESKARGYYIAAAAVSSGDLQATSRELRGLVRRGQRRIHFTHESDSSRRSILSSMCELDVRVVVYEVHGADDKTARTLCVEQLVIDAADGGANRLVLERDESLEHADRKLIAATLRGRDGRADLQYAHAGPAEHPQLWVADAVAWCYQARGDWIRRCDSIVEAVVRLR
ncbi:hypothetical protein ELQ92_02170 [Labedella populi]|uniref:DUF3800 domain-containing protein n=1 Tax=Labedella populi TaxID=2498850 RepID=A0A3S4BDH6_9MICO|nr:hypothetical protein [Labedella populi]RWZ68078.1 hypothetical protein ELQ92_02170 [Labedella populi]